MKEVIIYLPATELKPYKNNPRDNTEAVKAVAESIRKFGFRSPIVIDEGNTVINGHTRLKAAKRLGIDEVPCVRVTDLSEEQKREYRLVDNKTSEFAKWDQDLLAAELKECNFEGWNFQFNFEDDTKKKHSWGHTAKLCGLEPKPRMRKAGDTFYHSIFKTGKDGKPLEEIKTEAYIQTFAEDAAAYLEAMLGGNLGDNGWCALTTPRRRSARDGKKIHFATEVCRKMAGLCKIPFYQEPVKCFNFDRFEPEFVLEKRPEERNVILYDDIITTGFTINTVRELLVKEGYTVMALISIDNH